MANPGADEHQFDTRLNEILSPPVLENTNEKLSGRESETISPVPPKSRVAFLDGLRAIACLWVVFGHCHLFAFGWHAHSSLLGKPLDLLLYMHLGVNVFLVLSGYCLALPVIRNNYHFKQGKARFLLARAARILLAYFACLVFILFVNILLPIVAWGHHLSGLTGDIPASVLVVNFLLLQDVFPQLNKINGPFWSIAIEWHLYFIFPLMIWTLRRKGLLALILGFSGLAAGLTWVQLMLPRGLGFSLPSPTYYVALLMMGFSAAVLTTDHRYLLARARISNVGYVAVAILSVLLMLVLWKFRITNAGSADVFLDNAWIIDPICGATCAALLIVLSGMRNTHPVMRALASRHLAMIGSISYSLYLVHIPVLAFVHRFSEYLGIPHFSSTWEMIFMLTVGGSASGFTACMFYHLFEKPSIQLSHKF